MKISLDASAVRELFPEGSEARVQLSQAVIAEYTRKTLPKYLDANLRSEIANVVDANLTAQGSDEIRAGIRDALDEYVQSRMPSLQMLNQGKDKIRAETRKIAKQQISNAVHDALSDELKALGEEVKTKVTELAPMYLATFREQSVTNLVRNYSTKAVERALKELEKEMQQDQEKAVAAFIDQHSAE
ncbi:TPA: hypothetical protein P0E30_003748 [Vibrio harveyi]|nr:hypothetical protein [Vibrio harveyi]